MSWFRQSICNTHKSSSFIRCYLNCIWSTLAIYVLVGRVCIYILLIFTHHCQSFVVLTRLQSVMQQNLSAQTTELISIMWRCPSLWLCTSAPCAWPAWLWLWKLSQHRCKWEWTVHSSKPKRWNWHKRTNGLQQRQPYGFPWIVVGGGGCVL
jgi:hypothetical protein